MTMKGGTTTAIFCLAVCVVLAGNGVIAKFVSSNPCTALQNGSKMPNTEDCSSYFVCEFNQMTKTQCDEGTLFDPEYLVCNWASLVECGETPILMPMEEVTTRRPVRVTVRPTTTARTTTTARITTTARPAPPAPAWKPEPPVFVQDMWWPHGNKYWRPEPAPYFPSYSNYQVQYPQYGFNSQNMNNQPEPVTETTTIATTTRSTTARTTTKRTTTPRTTSAWTTRAPPTRAPYTPPRKPSAVIPLDGDQHLKCDNRGLYFISHPKNCENYYICTNGVMVLHQCASGVHWNEKESQCDFPHRANCYANQRPALAERALGEPYCDGTQRFLEHETDCAKYYICAGSTPTLMSCPDNFLWNSNISQCAESSTVRCTSN